MNKVTIFHNPQCSKSRQTLAILEEQNIKPEIILYKEVSLDHEQLSEVLHLLGLSARELMRRTESEYAELNLSDEGLSEDDLINAMIATPNLIQRPIVIANGKARIGRPPESVLEIL